MPKKRPLVIVTRRLPDVIETRMAELFETKLNVSDKPMSQAELVEAAKVADVLVPIGQGERLVPLRKGDRRLAIVGVLGLLRRLRRTRPERGLTGQRLGRGGAQRRTRR